MSRSLSNLISACVVAACVAFTTAFALQPAPPPRLIVLRVTVTTPIDPQEAPGSSLGGLNETVLTLRAEAARQQEAARVAAEAAHVSADWDAIARCETGGNWRMQGRTFSGGVGFANSTWNGFGGRQFASNAGQATREQQIVVAERVHARYGLSGWGCRRFG